MTSEFQERALFGEIRIKASLDEAWDAWTTAEGIRSFFAPGCHVNLIPDGPYEIYFDPSAPPGERGGDGLKVLAIQPKKMLSFTWNAPNTLPQIRPQRTHVIVRFYEEGPNLTRVTLRHDGWGDGGEWDEAYRYFEGAWFRVVLPRLQYRFENGPVDWENPPKLLNS